MDLIGQFDSPFVRRVAVALRHYDLAFTHRPLSVWADATEIAKYSPLVRVPVLVMEGGTVLLESAAILDALDEMAPSARRLIPKEGTVRRDILRVTALATGLGDKAVSLFMERVLRKEACRSPVWSERCEAQIKGTLDLLEKERAAAGDSFWFGRLTHADVAVACALRFTGEAHPGLLASSRPALRAHAERCEAIPLFQGAVQPLHVALDSTDEA